MTGQGDNEDQGLPAGAPKDMLKQVFAERLQSLLNERGWSQTDLARRASTISNKNVTRDRISKYAGGKALPTGPMLAALAKALGVSATDLVPTRRGGIVPTDNPPLDVKEIGHGMVWMKVNQSVRWPVALKIMELLRGEGTDGAAEA